MIVVPFLQTFTLAHPVDFNLEKRHHESTCKFIIGQRVYKTLHFSCLSKLNFEKSL